MSTIKLLDGPMAQYHRATGLLVVETQAEMILRALQSNSRNEYENELIFAYWHEWVHHIQSLSCWSIWLEGLKKIQAAGNLLFSEDKQAKIDSAILLARLKRRFDYRAFGISIRDLCEGVAVLESFKIHVIEPTAEKFLSWRDTTFPGKGNSPYRRTFDILMEEANAEVAFDLLPVLTFMALQGDVPGASFDAFLYDNRVRNGQFIGLSANQIVTDMGFGVLIERFSRISELHPSQRHKTLYPILANIVDSIGPDSTLEIFARPHIIMDQLETSGNINESLFVPLIVGASKLGSGRMLAFGVARRDKVIRLGIIHLNSNNLCRRGSFVIKRKSYTMPQ